MVTVGFMRFVFFFLPELSNVLVNVCEVNFGSRSRSNVRVLGESVSSMALASREAKDGGSRMGVVAPLDIAGLESPRARQVNHKC